MSRISERNNKPKKKFHQRKGFLISIGIIIGVVFVAALYQTSVYFSTNESCMMCHVHPHAEESWQLSVHVNNGSGVTVNCVDCHLPPSDNTWAHYSAKALLGARDLWGYLTKDSADFNWDQKSELEYAIKYIPNESCVKCHQNLFPEGITDDGITAHLYYDDNVEKLDLQCISCHLDAGHYNPNYAHGQMVGIPGIGGSYAVDTRLFDLLLGYEHDFIYSNITSGVVSAITSGVGKSLKSGGVIKLTLLSVHCADKITAISN
jgi:sulfatase modifying factor 1